MGFFMVRGVWVHQDRQGDRDRARAYAKATCNHANTYIGYRERIKQVDTMCARCGRRVRFNPNRKIGDGRGKVTQVLFLSMPNSSRSKIEARAKHLNQVDSSTRKRGGGGESFATALELMKEKTTPQVGDKSE